MKTSFRILPLSVLSLIAGIQPAVGYVHPVSHTDGWVKVAKTVDVRLNVFLDDVLRHHECLPEADTTLARTVVEEAIAAHGQRLLQQLRIFQDAEHPLVGSVVSEPRWESTGEIVNLAIDSSLKLTWKLQFVSPTEEPIRRLLFLHDFTHESLDQTGELRLHLQDSATGRRIDSVIPARQPHTILLPQADENVVARADAVNQLSARVVVGPTHVIVELSGPVLLMDFALPEVGQLKRGLSFAGDRFVEPVWGSSEQQHAKAVIQTWAVENLQTEINGLPRDPSFCFVDFIPIANDKNADSVDSEQAVAEVVPLMDTSVGVRLSYLRGLTVSSVAIRMKQSPGVFDEASISVCSFNERFSMLQTLNNADALKDCLEFDWILTESELVAAAEPTVMVNSPDIVKRENHYPGRVALLFAAVSGILLFGCWGLLGGKRLRMLCAVAVTGVSIAVIWFPGRTYIADSERLANVMQRNLSEIYNAVQQNNELTSVNLLSEVLDDDMLEDIYLGALHSLSSESDDPLALIRSIEVRRCDATKVESVDRLVAECLWNVDVVVEHWGHSHDRRLQFRGNVGLVFDGVRWKIRSFQATGVPQPASRPGSAVPG